MTNVCLIGWFWVDVTTKAQIIAFADNDCGSMIATDCEWYSFAILSFNQICKKKIWKKDMKN